VGQQNPVGRRRALGQRAGAEDEQASHAVMASLWRLVSRVQERLGHRLLHFEDTPADARVAEQLALIAVLHDWHPVTESEVADLSYLMNLYLEPVADATHDGVARALVVAIRSMAARRTANGSAGAF
jgi:hypothetical protein